MKLKLFLILFGSLLASISPAQTEDIEIGEETISIPWQQYFWKLRPSFSPLYEVMTENVIEENQRLITFMPSEFSRDAAFGKVPYFERYYAIEIEKEFIDKSVPAAQFFEMASERQAGLDGIREDILANAPDLRDPQTGQLKADFDQDLAFSLSQLVPVEANESDPLALSYSIYVRHVAHVPGRSPANETKSATFVYMLVKGKPLQLFVFGGANDMAWNRQFTTGLVNEILLLNSAGFEDYSNEQRIQRQADNNTLLFFAFGAFAVLFIGFAWWRSRTRRS